ncbi:MAG TPA: class I SAM-dependent methyltransferase [Pyrinomonadaceae bacterium]|nr:class I SAM-dependent methyltransferase [Pyrinomonadaceae bacterium]
MRSWTSTHYPEEVQDLGFDQQQALRRLARLPRKRVLEIGCSDGRFLAKAESLGHQATGIDFSPFAVKRARANGLDVRDCNLKEIMSGLARSEKFDAIALFQVIEHLEEPKEIFSQLHSFAAPDASLFVGCPSHLRFARRFRHPQRVGLSDFWDYPPQHTLRWNPESLRRFLENHGWTVEATEFEPFKLVGAAAYMTALYGLDSGWYRKISKRRIETLKWMGRLLWQKALHQVTGIRLFVEARLANSPEFSKGQSTTSTITKELPH